jgi:hypothetical protein
MKNSRAFVCWLLIILVVILSLGLQGCNTSIAVKLKEATCPVCGRQMEYKCTYCESIAEKQLGNSEIHVDSIEKCQHPRTEREVLIDEWKSYPTHVFEKNVCYTYTVDRIYKCNKCGEDIWVTLKEFEISHNFNENGECIECGYTKIS